MASEPNKPKHTFEPGTILVTRCSCTVRARCHVHASAHQMLEVLEHILKLADENAKGMDGYEQIAEWSRAIITKAKGMRP